MIRDRIEEALDVMERRNGFTFTYATLRAFEGIPSLHQADEFQVCLRIADAEHVAPRVLATSVPHVEQGI